MGLFLALTIGFRPQRRLGAMVAHRSCKAGVAGSSPAVGSFRNPPPRSKWRVSKQVKLRPWFALGLVT